MAANVKIKKIVKNSKMKRVQWKWIFIGSKTYCTIVATISVCYGGQNKKNPPIWVKFGFQVDYDVAN
jgi:hypothetical protein